MLAVIRVHTQWNNATFQSFDTFPLVANFRQIFGCHGNKTRLEAIHTKYDMWSVKDSNQLLLLNDFDSLFLENAKSISRNLQKNPCKNPSRSDSTIILTQSCRLPNRSQIQIKHFPHTFEKDFKEVHSTNTRH